MVYIDVGGNVTTLQAYVSYCNLFLHFYILQLVETWQPTYAGSSDTSVVAVYLDLMGLGRSCKNTAQEHVDNVIWVESKHLLSPVLRSLGKVIHQIKVIYPVYRVCISFLSVGSAGFIWWIVLFRILTTYSLCQLSKIVVFYLYKVFESKAQQNLLR